MNQAEKWSAQEFSKEFQTYKINTTYFEAVSQVISKISNKFVETKMLFNK